jgi:hypothetical protein
MARPRKLSSLYRGGQARAGFVHRGIASPPSEGHRRTEAVIDLAVMATHRQTQAAPSGTKT